MAFAYTVAVELADPTVFETYLAWLRDGHLADVIAGGAQSAEVVRLDGDIVAVEIRFRFADRATFDAYIRDHAPRLRAESAALFPAERGFTYRRLQGEIVIER